VGRLTRFVFPGLLLVAGYYALYGGEYSVFEVRRARAELEQARIRLDSLEAVNAALAARADSLETDSATLERLAREQYGMIRDGEVLYRFVEDSARADSVAGGDPERR
jgi:cell division protein FtsB